MKKIDPVGFFTGLSMFLFGLGLYNPWVNTFASISNYARMGMIASEGTWGIVFGLSGFILLWGSLARNKILFFTGASLVLLSRLFLSVLIGIQTNWASNGIPDFGVWALMALYCMARAFRYEPK